MIALLLASLVRLLFQVGAGRCDALIEYVKAQDAVWEACEGAPIYAAKRLESAEAALLAALRGGK